MLHSWGLTGMLTHRGKKINLRRKKHFSYAYLYKKNDYIIISLFKKGENAWEKKKTKASIMKRRKPSIL